MDIDTYHGYPDLSTVTQWSPEKSNSHLSRFLGEQHQSNPILSRLTANEDSGHKWLDKRTAFSSGRHFPLLPSTPLRPDDVPFLSYKSANSISHQIEFEEME
ncbi:hypothetical protein ACTXT7_011174 [Hymenolepis weldensis]